MIWHNIFDLKAYLDWYCKDSTIVATSGGFDPLHVGHSRCILASSAFGNQLVVIVNSDNFLKRKKGYVFMPLNERMEIISSLKGVSHVVNWDDGTQYVAGALAILQPNIFTKGGDRSTPESIAECEREVCRRHGIKLMLGIGGSNKSQSSSALVKGSKACLSSIKELT